MSLNRNDPGIAGGLQDLSGDEQRLVRLFRCMVNTERHDLLRDEGLILMKRLSVDPYFRRADNPSNTDAEEDPDERLLGTWPGRWPGQTLLDLDDLGDPGVFIDEYFVDPAENLLGSSVGDELLADTLSDAFLNWEWPDPPPYLFDYEQNDLTTDDLRTTLQHDFLAFIRAWRERIVQTLERHSRPGGDGEKMAP